MENQNPISLLGSFLFKALALFIFESLECFLKSFDAIIAYLSVTLLARFNKDWLIFSNTTLNKTII
ncbi:hypothetical protein ECC10_02230 [Helicobacter pylori]|uniref:hypothetical protein n=1 Tax=Helicobacter pylori TaxID=210 RepID=UPI000FDF3176|nr:hypothetical protein [Helicobacter pylori]MDU9767462.1 hypothetical protein [Helicobacter pylori]RVY28360.1 hypothetical protein ECC10_02230 [Helicobacter pylori]